jgi:hypothetical protein
MALVVAAHAGHFDGHWVAAIGLVAVSMTLLIIVAVLMDRRPPK